MAQAERERQRHPLEKRVKTLVAGVDAILVAMVVALLLWGAEWISARPTLAKHKSHGRLLLIAVLGAPLVTMYAPRRRRLLASEEGIHVSPTQLPEVHDVLARHCRRLGVPLPELYLSDGVDRTTSFSWRGHNSIIAHRVQELRRAGLLTKY